MIEDGKGFRGTALALVQPQEGTRLERILAEHAWRFRAAADADGLLEALESEPGVDLVLVSLAIDGVDRALVESVRERIGEAELLLSSPRTTLEAVLLARDAGKTGLLREPLEVGDLTPFLLPRGGPEGGLPLEAAPTPDPGSGLVVAGPATARVVGEVAELANGSFPVLLQGEPGTGREQVARAIHRAGRRRVSPFVGVDLGALPEDLLERELFGEEARGANGDGFREGRVERAEGGTLFLREVAGAGRSLQGRLFRMLNEFSIERIGGNRTLPVDVRIVAATDESLDPLVETGRFRPDLRDRLGGVRIALLPLRERSEEILPLALHFARIAAERQRRRVLGLGGDARELLRSHNWPGNLRELRQVMERAVLRSRGPWIGAGELALGEGTPHLSPRDGADAGYLPTRSLEEVERDHIRKVLRYTGGAMGRAAEILGIHRNTLTRKVEQFDLRPELEPETGPGELRD